MSICEDWGIDPNRRVTCEKCGHVWGPLGPGCPMCAMRDMQKAFQPKWIKRSEKLPKEEAWVLGYCCNAGVVITKCYPWDEEPLPPTITHWMPLPEPPAV